MKVSQYVSTKKTEDDVAVKTLLTVDFKDWTLEQFANYAFGKAAISWQSNARKAKEAIPTTATYTPGQSIVTITPEQALSALVGADKAAALITKFGDANKAIEAIKDFIS